MSRLGNKFSEIQSEVFEYGPVVIFKCKNEPGWPIEFVSGNIGLNFGYTVSQLTSKEMNYEKLIHPLDIDRVKKESRDTIVSNMLSIEHEPYRILTGKGEIRWVSDFTTVIKENNRITFLGYIVDITDQIEKENFLIEVKDRYDKLLDATREGVWDWDLRTDEVFFSKRWKEMLGFREDEIRGSLLEWEKRVHIDDLDKCYSDIKAHLNGDTDIYENVHRVKHKNGQYIWILDRGIRILDNEGNAYRMIGTHKDITEEKILSERLKKMAREDSLTGLLNRRAFYEILQREIENNKRYKRKLSIIMFDIDFFKKINDSFGHSFGDIVIKFVSTVMSDIVRSSDYVFRLGGEEFCVLLPETDLDGALELAERIRWEIEVTTISTGREKEISVTISGGLRCYNEELSLDQFMEQSDQALYFSKQNGRNKITVYSDIK